MAASGGAGADPTTESYAVEPWDASALRDATVTLIVGCRRTGKSALLRSLVQSAAYDVVVGISPSEPYDRALAPRVTAGRIFADYDAAEVARLFADQAECRARGSAVPRAALVLDECTFDDITEEGERVQVRESRSFRRALARGRHAGVSVFVAVQCCLDFPPGVREQFDRVFVLGATPHAHVASGLYRLTRFSDRDFRAVHRECVSTPRGCAVIDCRSGDVFRHEVPPLAPAAIALSPSASEPVRNGTDGAPDHGAARDCEPRERD